MRSTLIGLGEDRHDLRRAARDHAVGIGGKLLAEGDTADGHPELAHRLLGCRVLAPGSLDEAARLRLLTAEEVAELIQRRDVVPRALSQPARGLLEVAGLQVAEDADDGLGRPVTGDRIALQLEVVPPGHGDNALLYVPLAELDHDRHALTDPLPALLRWLSIALVDLHPDRPVGPILIGDLRTQRVGDLENGRGIVARDRDDLDLL